MKEQEQLVKSRKFYLRLLVIALFVFALLHSINPFFFRFFFWISFGMGAMSIYYHIALKIAERGTQAQFRPQGQRAQWTQPQQQGNTPIQSQVKKAIGIVVAVVFFIFFLLLLIGIFVGDDEIEKSADEDAFIEAETLYENQEYRKAIDLAKPLLSAETTDVYAINIVANSYYELKEIDSAFLWYDKAYALGDRGAFQCHVLAYVHDNRGNTARAVELYQESLSMDSSRIEIYERLAELEPEKKALYQKLKERNKSNQ